MTALQRITIYPIKSLAGVHLKASVVLPSGALRNDRRWAIVDEAGNFVNGKRTPAVHTIRAAYSDNFHRVTLSTDSMRQVTFDLIPIEPETASWLSNALGKTCKLIENTETGFPDDLVAPGPTIVSQGTIREIGDWFSLSDEEVHRRFRANLVVDADESFWEDRLVGVVGQPVSFTIGAVSWFGINMCQRCVVPSRDPTTGEAISMFQREFTQRRQATLPVWTRREIFDHFYRLAVNTRLAESRPEMWIRVGDEVRYLDSGAAPI